MKMLRHICRQCVQRAGNKGSSSLIAWASATASRSRASSIAESLPSMSGWRPTHAVTENRLTNCSAR